MEQRTLGRTGWRVGEIGCGTYKSFDQTGKSGQQAVDRLLAANLAEGVNLIDTAPMYGHAEATLGQALKNLAPDARPWVASKVLQNDVADAKRQIENSFSLLGRIDLMQIHNMAGWRKVLPYLHDLKAEGRIRAVGITHYDSGAFGEIEAAAKTGQADVLQIPYNIMERQVERRLLPLAREMNLGVLVMTPISPIFGRGELRGRLGRIDLAPYAQYGVSDAGSLCLKYLLSVNPDVVPIPATSRTGRVRTNAAVSGTPPLPPDVIEKLARDFG